MIISCKCLEKELELAIRETSCKMQVRWVNQGLHNTPSKLKEKLQEELNNVPLDCKRVLFGFGTCGNSVIGLRTCGFELVIPRVDDCITLLLGSTNERRRIQEEASTYFLTRGWLDGERTLLVEYNYAVSKYGEDSAHEIFDMMLSEYKRLGMLETGAYDMEQAITDAKKTSSSLNLPIERIPASIGYLKKLLIGKYTSEEFIIIPPYTEVTALDVMIK